MTDRADTHMFMNYACGHRIEWASKYNERIPASVWLYGLANDAPDMQCPYCQNPAIPNDGNWVILVSSGGQLRYKGTEPYQIREMQKSSERHNGQQWVAGHQHLDESRQYQCWVPGQWCDVRVRIRKT